MQFVILKERLGIYAPSPSVVVGLNLKSRSMNEVCRIPLFGVTSVSKMIIISLQRPSWISIG
jgi:hypothetical protein